VENIRTKIQLAVEGGREVGKLSDQIKNLGKDLRLINTGAQGVVNSFRVVNKVLSEAKKNFRDVSLDTTDAAKAAEQLVAANNQVNETLRQRNQLLQDAGNKLARAL
jgi:methyl-accepting chemotaxis protein